MGAGVGTACGRCHVSTGRFGMARGALSGKQFAAGGKHGV